MISDDVPKTEWARLAFYASHVATVGVRGLFRNNKKRRISPAVWSHIGRLASGKPLLPNLREISWSWTSIQCFALPHIIPPSLRHLTVSVSITHSYDSMENGTQESEAAFRMMLLAVFSIAPELASLAIISAKNALAPIGKLHHLQKLTFDEHSKVNANELHALAALRALKHLKLGQADISGVIHPPFAGCGFNNLETLSVEFHPQTAHMYEVFSCPQLDSLDIKRYPATTSLSFHDTCQRWARSFPSLRNIHCDFVHVSHPKNDNREALGRAISPLFAIPTISSVRLGLVRSHFTVSDADIHDIARAWPGLVTLQLSLRPPSFEQLSMASLIHLARNCPQLKTLHLLPLMFTQTALEDVESFPLLDHGLRELNIEQVRLDWEQYSLSALLLDRIFPHLDVNARDIMADPSGGSRRLERCVWLCQQARRQQEQRVRCHAAQDSSSLVPTV